MKKVHYHIILSRKRTVDHELLVADLYLILYDTILTNPNIGHGREGFYFGENGEHRLYDVGKAISQALFDLGRSKSAELATFTKEEVVKYFGVWDFSYSSYISS